MPSSSNLALAEETVNGSSATGGAEKEATRVGGGEGEEMDAALRAALGKLVRSKGFMWLAFSDKAAMYWSHAGELALPLDVFARPSAHSMFSHDLHIWFATWTVPWSVLCEIFTGLHLSKDHF